MLESLWFWLAAVTVAVYVVADGFDFGAGILHLIVAKTDAERRTVLSAIGPFWDGNEVWLLATGGVLFLAFPKVLAAGLSGFYLPIMLVIWGLILRGISIEFRSHHDNPLWRMFFDTTFAASSAALPLLLGAALGNLVRGLPLDASGYLHMPLFTNFLPMHPAGVLDIYTVAIGLFAVLALAAHGATFLVWKTDGLVQQRSRRLATRLWWGVAAALIPVTWATARVNTDVFAQFSTRPLAWLLAASWIAGLMATPWFLRRRQEWPAFASSSLFLLGLLAATAACVFPVMLRSQLDRAHHLTAFNASAPEHSLTMGLWWWGLGVPLAIAYSAVLMRIHRGKVSFQAGEGGY